MFERIARPLLAFAALPVKIARRPSLAVLLVGIGIIVGAAQVLALIWVGDSTYLRTETDRHSSETNRLAIVMANGMSDRLRNVEHMTRRVVREVPHFIQGDAVAPGILDLALDDIAAYAQSNEIGIGLFTQDSGGDFSITQYRGSADYRALFTKETGSIRQLITTAATSNHTEATVAQAVIALNNPAHEDAANEREKRKILFALTATPILKTLDTDHPEVERPKSQVFLVSLAILFPAHPEQGADTVGCIFSVCEAALRAETGARWNFISSDARDRPGKAITASAPIWPLPMEVVVTTHVAPLSSGIPSLRYRIIGTAILSAGAILLLFTAAAHVLIRRPMATLMRGIAQLASAPSTRLKESRLKEFAQAFAGFNSMAAQIEDAQKQLSASEEHWRRLIEGNEKILFLIDAESELVTFANSAAEAFYGIPRRELVGRALASLDADQGKDAPPGDMTKSVRLQHRTADGPKSVDASFGSTMIGGRKTLLAIIDDASAEDELRAEAERAQRARVEMLEERLSQMNDMLLRERGIMSTISHEIINPIAIISGAMENFAASPAAGDEAAQEKATRRVNNVKNALNRITDIIRRGLDNGRKQSGFSSTAQISREDIGAFVSSIAAVWVDSDTRHDYRLSISKDAMPAEFDKTLIQSVIDNVVHNAQKYSPAGKSISISTYRKDAGRRSWAIIEVADQGIGIPKDFVPLIGEQRQRAGNTGNYPGNGVGLHLSKQIVSMHGGSMEFESEEGAGTTALIRIPLSLHGPKQKEESGHELAF